MDPKPFEEEEMLEIIKQCAIDKATGLDEFSMVFCQNCWAIVKEDITKGLALFHR